MKPFTLERWFSQYEFNTQFMLCSSDCETLSLQDLLQFEKVGPQVLLGLKMGYSQTNGQPKLLKAISQTYDKIGVDDVFLTVGGEQAIYCFMRSFLQPEDHVIGMVPCYQSLTEVAKTIGCQVSEWNFTFSEEVNKLDWDLKDLDQLIQSNTQLLIINSPHNPTGKCFNQSEVQEIVKFCSEKNIYLFFDELYRDLCWQPEFQKPKSACDLYEKAISLGSLSQGYGLPGLRIGWVATQAKQVLDGMRVYKDYLSMCNPVICEELAYFALKNRNEIVGNNLELIKSNYASLEQFISKYSQIFSFSVPSAGCLVFVQLRKQFQSEFQINTLQLAELLIKEKSVLLLPSCTFNSENNDYFRIGFGQKNFKEALKLFEDLICQQFKSWIDTK